ncbi:hypothetical protein [Nocardia brasiliensis]|uniref:hypothetical protein n=1 Tax=Nocardia brasiliensis TaxID=37326 RepID=UPI00366F466F
MSESKDSGRGSTRPGMRAPMPEGYYEPPAPVVVTAAGQVVVQFHGEDGRHRSFNFAECALPGWHADVAVALAQRIGPAGGLRTSSSVLAAWLPLKLFLRSLAQWPDPPEVPEQLRVEHVSRFIDERCSQDEPIYGRRQVVQLAQLLRVPPLGERIDTAVHEKLVLRVPAVRGRTQQGYSDAELHRLLAAARTDVSRLRTRLHDGGTRLEQADAGDVDADQDLRAVASGQSLRYDWQTKAAAAQLFPLRDDLPAMMVLLVAVTGRNIETIKELPAEHRILDNRAVEVRLTKRRRGQGRWTETVTWEIGRPGQDLRQPGGLYLLLHELMARSRALAHDPRWFWSYWRSSNAERHGSPFRAALTAGIDVAGWSRRRQLTYDDGTPLSVHFGRLRISIEVRRTQRMGGHLPSAARSNTAPVLFRDYLRADPTMIDWAQRVTSSALVDAEAAALDAHQRQLDAHGGEVVRDRGTGDHAAEGGVWSDCRDPASHPATGKSCRATFLDCFHCGNAIVTPEHLPRLLALLEALDSRRAVVSEAQWWARYGPAWAAIRHDILAKFSVTELDHARRQPGVDALLDLVEAPWEHP